MQRSPSIYDNTTFCPHGEGTSSETQPVEGMGPRSGQSYSRSPFTPVLGAGAGGGGTVVVQHAEGAGAESETCDKKFYSFRKN